MFPFQKIKTPKRASQFLHVTLRLLSAVAFAMLILYFALFDDFSYSSTHE